MARAWHLRLLPQCGVPPSGRPSAGVHIVPSCALPTLALRGCGGGRALEQGLIPDSTPVLMTSDVPSAGRPGRRRCPIARSQPDSPPRCCSQAASNRALHSRKNLCFTVQEQPALAIPKNQELARDKMSRAATCEVYTTRTIQHSGASYGGIAAELLRTLPPRETHSSGPCPEQGKPKPNPLDVTFGQFVSWGGARVGI